MDRNQAGQGNPRRNQTQTKHTDSEPAWHLCPLFLLKALKTQKDQLLSRLDTEQQALATLPPLARSISEFLASKTRVWVASTVAAAGASSNTLRAALSRMSQKCLLVRQGSGRSIHYTQR